MQANSSPVVTVKPTRTAVSTHLTQAAFSQTWDSEETPLSSCQAARLGDSLCPDLPKEQEGVYHRVEDVPSLREQRMTNAGKGIGR